MKLAAATALVLTVWAAAGVEPARAQPAPAGAAEYPFVYLGQGPAYARKGLAVWIWFRGPVPDHAMERIAVSAPMPISVVAARNQKSFRGWSRDVLRVNGDDFLEDAIRIAYNPKFRARLRSESYDDVHALMNELFEKGSEERAATGEEWAAFNADLDRWLRSTHERQPILFAVKAAGFREEPGAWHRWSLEHGTEEVISTLEKSLRGNKVSRFVQGAAKPQVEGRDPPVLAELLHAVLRHLLAGPEATEAARIAALPPALRGRLVELIQMAAGTGASEELDAENQKILRKLRAAGSR